MPHIHIDYSGNLENLADVSALCEALRAEAVSIDGFPLAGVKVRAIRVDHYAIADGSPKHGFVDISIRIREGRAPEVKQAAVERIFAAAKKFLEPVFEQHSVSLSAELRDIDAHLSPKTGTIRRHLEIEA